MINSYISKYDQFYSKFSPKTVPSLTLTLAQLTTFITISPLLKTTKILDSQLNNEDKNYLHTLKGLESQESNFNSNSKA